MEWYYAEGNQQMGPVSDTQLAELEAMGRIHGETLVWKAGLASWSPYKTVRPQPTAPIHPPPYVALPGAAEPAPAPTRFCSQCGQARPAHELVAIGQALVCANCKDSFVQRMREGAPPAAGHRVYAGFWIRFVAAIIDGLILGFAVMLLIIPVGLLIGLGAASDPPGAAVMVMSGMLYLVALGLACCYDGYFLSTRGGTPGKLILSLQVIRGDGSRPSFGLGVGRYFAKMVSAAPLYLGFLMAGFDDEKRTLHDRICNTRVVVRRA